ncbi:MAG TPA: hypothetical protein P5205_06370 [Candidatus Paceibacterota bacterium]|nr:hypothetical protein [Verrucomicrobiota bacterium]HSA09980.1 hypothetical protein [Candidatus Paceibacterota bacterium]
MKISYLKTEWLAPVLGAAVVAGSLMATTTYLDLERKVRANEALMQTLDRLSQDQTVCAALKSIHDGDVEGATRRLDVLLCENILKLNADLESTDVRTRTYVEDNFIRIALTRPKTAGAEATGSNPISTEDQAAAERILSKALANIHTAQAR